MRQLITIRRVLVLKGIVAVGLLAAYFLPTHMAVLVGASANMIWLWKI